MANARAKSKTGARAPGKAARVNRPAKPAVRAGKPAKASSRAAPAKPARPVRPAKAAAKATRATKAAKPTAVARVERPEVVVIAPRVERPAKVERIPEKFDAKASAQPEPFRLVAIERTEPPTGAAGKNWFRYTIRQGGNAINGYLQGTAAGVKTAAEQIVGQLNERRAGRWGYRTTRAAAPAATG